jgi:hypothetical protein
MRYIVLLLALLVDAAQASADPVRGAVIDLCTQRETSDGTQSVKQRAVILGPAGLERFDADPKLGSLAASTHARETFMARFPLDRLYGVVTAIPGDAAWLDRPSVALAEVRDAVERAPVVQPFAGDEPDAAARERAFVGYSLGCADLVLVPVVDRVDVTWSWQYVEDRALGAQATPSGASASASVQNGRMYLPTVDVSVRVGVFRRQGDALVLAGVVAGDSGHHSGMPDLPPASAGSVPTYTSAVPDASCTIGPPVDGSAGVTCADGTARSSMIAYGRNEFSGSVCQARDMTNPDVWALCTVRLQTELAVGGVQKRVRELPEMRLYAELRRGNQDDAGGPGIALGRHEGVKVGYGFFTKNAAGDITSFFKVTDPGPGGAGGDQQRTALRSRFGEYRFGDRVYEYPQSNWYLGVRLEGGPLGGMSPPTMFTTGALAGTTASFPSWVGGLGLSFMWDCSGITNMTEARTGAEIHALFGATSSVRFLALPIDFPNLEKGFYIAPRTKLYASLAFSAGWLFESLAGQDQGVSVEALQGYLIGVASAVGVELMATPDRLIRFDVSARTYGHASVDTTADTAELDARDDHYSTIMARLSVEVGL